MKTYLVGGAVRDELLGLPVTERDWVVVGATPDDMLALGYQQVGKSFPVFLHPRTSEEYALARTERKTGSGHTGFECDSSSSVTLEQDLFRRDLTINAIARDKDGTLVDVTGGIDDIEHRLLRHIGEAFAEDPLRVLRVARFAAKLAPEGFRIAPETFAQCQRMVARGDLGELTPERVFLETEKALKTTSAHTYFSSLALMNAASLLWPELDDFAVATLAAYEQQDRSRNPASKFAILFLRTDAAAIASRCDALRTPDLYRQLAMLAARHHEAIKAIDSVSAEDIVELVKACDAIRKPDRFHLLLDTIATQTGNNKLAVSWSSWFELVASTSRKDVDAGLKGPAIGEAITALQVKRVADYLATSR